MKARSRRAGSASRSSGQVSRRSSRTAAAAEGRARAITSVPMVLDAMGASATTLRVDRDPIGARILEALAPAPADPDALARRLGLRPAQLTTEVARLVVSGEVVCGADGRLARR